MSLSVHFALSLCVWMCMSGYFLPEQIHVSFGVTPDIITFNWLTFDYPIQTQSFVKIGLQPLVSSLNMNNTGNEYLFTDLGSLRTNRTIHVVSINNLLPSTRYYYQCGDPLQGWSDIYTFKTSASKDTLMDNLPMKLLMIGDMGTTNTQALPAITEVVLNQDTDFIVHVGDFAYDMYEENGTRGDEFMRDIQTVSANTPYMVCHGNHESFYNFSHYTQRFRGQPSNTGTVWTSSGECPNNWYYSYNVGLIHFIALSTEIYFDFPYMIEEQYNWLIKDLMIANMNRTQAPWVIVYMHRDLYCSASSTHCTSEADRLIYGVNVNGSMKYGLEDVFYNFGVDFIWTGHVHNYERTWDVYHNMTTKTTTDMPAPTYINNGDAGNREGHAGFTQNQPTWSAYRTNCYSYSKIDVYNATHIHFRQIVSDNEGSPCNNGDILDDIVFIQHNHGPYSDNYGDISQINHVTNIDGITYDAYMENNMTPKIAKQDIEDTKYIPYISNNKDDYIGVEPMYL